MKLKSRTWYYLYIDGDDYLVSEDAPVRDGENGWHHPKTKRRCISRPLWIDHPKTCIGLKDFYYEKD